MRVEGGRTYNPGWHLSRDLRNLVLVSEAVTRCAMLRKDSRGAHSRLDHPALDPALGKVNMSVVRDGAEMWVRPAPHPEMPAELQALFKTAEPAGAKVG